MEKRYSEFDALHHLIKSQTSSHLKPSLPKLPGKVYNPMTDQLTEPFIAQRSAKLELYLGMLLGNSKLVHYQDVLHFFDLDYMGSVLAENIPVDESPTVVSMGGSGKGSSVVAAGELSIKQSQVTGMAPGTKVFTPHSPAAAALHAASSGMISPTYSDDEGDDEDKTANVHIPPHILPATDVFESNPPPSIAGTSVDPPVPPSVSDPIIEDASSTSEPAHVDSLPTTLPVSCASTTLDESKATANALSEDLSSSCAVETEEPNSGGEDETRLSNQSLEAVDLS